MQLRKVKSSAGLAMYLFSPESAKARAWEYLLYSRALRLQGFPRSANAQLSRASAWRKKAQAK